MAFGVGCAITNRRRSVAEGTFKGTVDLGGWPIAEDARLNAFLVERVAEEIQASLPQWPINLHVWVENGVPAIHADWDLFGEISASAPLSEALDEFLLAYAPAYGYDGPRWRQCPDDEAAAAMMRSLAATLRLYAEKADEAADWYEKPATPEAEAFAPDGAVIRPPTA
jgi:hypothetical protein